MKITIAFNKEFDFDNKEHLKRLIDREDFNERLKTAIDNGKGLSIENAFGQWIYKIRIDDNTIVKRVK